jgi:hypothetical protein
MLLGIVTAAYWVALLSILILPCLVYLRTPFVVPPVPQTMSGRIQQYVGCCICLLWRCKHIYIVYIYIDR